jgi:hypothetical protein
MRHGAAISWPGTSVAHFIAAGDRLPNFRQVGEEGRMRSQVLVGAFLVTAAFTVGTVATNGDGAGPVRQTAVVSLQEPTLIGTTIVEGPVLFIHDAEKMAHGEPCTSIRLFDPEKGPAEELVSFHCIPKARRVASRFTMTTRPNTELGFGCVLVEYQFAGDTEGHGVPPSKPLTAH